MTDRLTTLWQERYRTPLPDLLAKNKVCSTDPFAALLSHRSVRAYLPDALPEGTIDAAIAAAQSAATSSNLQCWSVVAVSDSDRRLKLAKLSGNQEHIATAPVFLVWLADLSRLERIATRTGQNHEALDYAESLLVATIDATLAAQNAVIALEAAGLGTVYIGGLRNQPLEIARELTLPPRCLGLFGLCVGYPDPARPANIKPRLPQRVVLHNERYDRSQEDALIAEYDALADVFQKEQGLESRLWTEIVASRIASHKSLHGRDSMMEALEALGFPMR